MTAWERLERRVREYARRNNIAPTELARRLGYVGSSRSWASEFLAGNRGLPLERLDLVARLCGTTVAELFSDAPPVLSAEAVDIALAFDSSDERARELVRVALQDKLPKRRREEPRKRRIASADT